MGFEKRQLFKTTHAWRTPQKELPVKNRAKDLFERIVHEGIDAIHAFIETRKSEELFLDFKRSSDNGSGTKLSANDRNNLSKAISGFGNSEGGVIVWGMDCSDLGDGSDVASAEVPIVNPTRFCSWLENAVSGCTIPPHSGVENHSIQKTDSDGFVITYIPKSIHSPHQMLPKQQYYIRAGSSFVPTPHDVLAGMFGKRPQPHVFHNYLLSMAEVEGEALKVSVGIAARNEGPGIASDVYVTSMIYESPNDTSEIRFEPTDNTNWTGIWAFERKISLISNSNYRLPPGVEVQPLVIHISLVPPFDGDLKIGGTVGSSRSPIFSFQIGNSRENIERLYNEYMVKHNDGTLTKEDRHSYPQMILNPEMAQSKA